MNAFLPQTVAQSALAIAVVGFAAIAGAWGFQWLGYDPCDLCLEQRYAFYVGVPLAAIMFLLASNDAYRPLVMAGMAALALIFAANAILSVYHSGVETGLWQGPTACTGSMAGPAKASNLMAQLQSIKIVRCDAVSLRVLGLTLANWDVLICAALAALAARATPRALSFQPAV